MKINVLTEQSLFLKLLNEKILDKYCVQFIYYNIFDIKQ